MKSILRLFLVPVVTLAFAGASYAQAKPATPAQPCAPQKKMETKAEKPKATRATGEVTSVDAKAGTLTVKVKDKDMNFTAQSKAAKGALGKVKVGDNVRVSYTEKDGKMIASSVTSAKAKEPAKKGEKAEKKAPEAGAKTK